jgi:hypothetical protein
MRKVQNKLEGLWVQDEDTSMLMVRVDAANGVSGPMSRAGRGASNTTNLNTW